jgi:hypothetical protein
VRKYIAYLYKKIRKRRSINSRPDHRGKEKYREKKDIIYKEKKEGKLKQRKGK